MKLCKLLIWSSLALTTGYAAPVVAQDEIGIANVSQGYGHGLARTLDSPSCAYENTAYPFSGLYGFGDINGDCSGDPVPRLYHEQTCGRTACWPGSWSIIDPSTPDIFGFSMWWNPDRRLTVLTVRAHDGDLYAGGWGVDTWDTPLEGQPTWDEFVSGTPIVIRLRWADDMDYLCMPSFSDPSIVGLEYAAWEPFSLYYNGARPWECEVEVTIECLNNPPVIAWHSFMQFAGQNRLTVRVFPDRCRADFDQSGDVGVPDVFAFLTYWFRGWVRADWSGDAVCGVEDVFAYLTDWFGGV